MSLNFLSRISWRAVLPIVLIAAIGTLPTRAAAEAGGGGFDTPDEIAALLHRVNDGQVARTRGHGENRGWARGTWYTGVMAAALATGDAGFFQQARDWGRAQQWQPGTERSGGNILTCTQTYLELYLHDHDRSMIEPTIRWLDSGQPNTPTGARVWYLESGRRYVDSLYVGAPALAMLAQATGDRRYLAWLGAFFWDVHRELFDESASLYYRDRRFIGAKSANGGRIFWARGNGWVFGSLVRILSHLPADFPSRAKYVDVFRRMAESLAARQQPDGLWRTNLDDAAEFPGPETSGSGFFCYGLAWGVRTGLLPRETYLPVVQRAWRGLASTIAPDGTVQWGQRVGDRPRLIQQSDTHEYVTGVFLLAGSEIFRLAKAGVPVEPALASRDPLLPPEAFGADAVVPPGHPLAAEIASFRQRQHALAFQPSGLQRKSYLDFVAGEVAAMRRYQDAAGRIVDPVAKSEQYYSTPCYALAVAALTASGYTQDAGLIESGLKAMDVATSDMAAGAGADGHGSFYIWPVMFAYEQFRGHAAADRVGAWEDRLRRIQPEKLYHRYRSTTSNWGMVSMAGEFLRERAGFATGVPVDELLGGNRQNFTPYGMFVEHDYPTAYDMFTRHFIAGMLQLGYHGAYAPDYRELLWRGAWTSLFLQSSSGELPTGYRSSQHIWNEAEQCMLFELYASACARAGQPDAAGAFKRAAHLSLQAMQRWVRPDGSGYIVKNRYPIEARHGYEGYSSHTCYNLLACAMLAQAWQFADDAVAERPAPADVGGFAVALIEPFHKVVANAAGTYIEYDLNGDQQYNPTGLIRIHLAGANPLLGPSDGCAAKFSGPGVSIAVGPSWEDQAGKWHSLAAWGVHDGPGRIGSSTPEVEVLESRPERVIFQVLYSIGPTDSPGQLVETVLVEPRAVTVTDEIKGDAKAMRVTWPMLVFDGQNRTNITVSGSRASVELGGSVVQFSLESPANAGLKRSGRVLNHRNGQVEPLTAEFAGRRAVYRIETR